MIRRSLSLGLCLFVVIATRALAEEPATKPSAEQEAVLKTFRDYNDAMMKLDKDTMSSLQATTNDFEKKVSQAMVEGDLAVARIKNAAQEKFGGDAAKRVGKAVNDISNDDLVDARVQIEGNTAKILGVGGNIGMIKDGGVWKFNLADARITSDEMAERVVAGNRGRAATLDALTADTKSGKFESVEELLTEIANRDK